MFKKLMKHGPAHGAGVVVFEPPEGANLAQETRPLAIELHHFAADLVQANRALIVSFETLEISDPLVAQTARKNHPVVGVVVIMQIFHLRHFQLEFSDDV